MHSKDTTRNKMFQLLDYVAVLRLTLLSPVWMLVLLGYHYGNTSPQSPDTAQPSRLRASLRLYTLLARRKSLVTPVLSAHLSLSLTDALLIRLRCLRNEDGTRLP